MPSYKALIGPDYSFTNSAGDLDFLYKVFPSDIPGHISMHEISRPFRLPCPLGTDHRWIGVPTDIWNLNKGKFTTLSLHRTSILISEDFENPLSRESDDDHEIKQRCYEMDRVSKDMLCNMVWHEDDYIPIGILLISDQDPATNYADFRVTIDESVKKERSETEMEVFLNDLQKGQMNPFLENAQAPRSTVKEYQKLLVEPVATCISEVLTSEGASLSAAPMMVKPARGKEEDALVDYTSRLNEEYLQSLITSSEILLKKSTMRRPYVIEIQGYANQCGQYEMSTRDKYAIFVKKNSDNPLTTGLIVKMNGIPSDSRTMSSLLKVFNASELEFVDDFETWSDKMFTRIKRASRIGGTTIDDVYDKVVPDKQ